ncbi:MAG: hypothetical protein SFV19_10055 [Rhodospirillaceae bacterium]|nr:hypothetical protein [Rhodospirillaceae bacterium]
MNIQEHEAEVDRNFDYFQGVVASLMAEHAGQHALLRHQQVDSFYDTSVAALIEGYKKFPDGLFSIQKVTVTPIDLGFYSHVGSLGHDRK